MRRLTTAALGLVAMLLGAGAVYLGLGVYYDPPDLPGAEVVWSATMGPGSGQARRTGPRDAFRPAPAGDIVVVADSGGIVALDSAAGQVRWRTEIAGVGDTGILHVESRPLVVDAERVYVTTGSALVVLDLRDGSAVWRRDIQGTRQSLGSVSPHGDVVVVHLENMLRPEHGDVLVLDAVTGEERWQLVLEAPLAYTGPAVAGEAVVLALTAVTTGADGQLVEEETELVAHDVHDGRELWRRPLDGIVAPRAAGDLVTAAIPGGLLALDPRTGDDVWSFTAPTGARVVLAAAVGPDAVAVATLVPLAAGELAAGVHLIDSAAGSEFWTTDLQGSITHLAATSDAVLVEIHSPFEARVLGLDRGSGQERWSQEASVAAQRGQSVSLRIAADGGGAYLVGDRPGVRALDPADGSLVWTGLVDADLMTDKRPLVADGVVHLTGPDGLVRAFDLASGELLWQQRLGTIGFSQPAVADGRIYATAGLGSLRAHDASDGSAVWRTDNRLDTVAQAVRPVVVGDVVVAGAGAEVWAVDTDSGREIWSASGEAAVAGIAAVAAGHVVVARTDGTVALVAGGDGEPLWTVRTGWQILAPPVVTDDVVVVGGEDGQLAGLDVGDGSGRWETRIEQAPVATPTAADRLVLVADGTRLLALDPATGGEVWRHESGAELHGQVTVADGQVLVTSGGRDVLVLDPADGSRVGLLDMNEPLVAAPAGGGGLVVVVSEQGRIFAIR